MDSLCKLLASSCGGGGGGVLCARTFTCKLGDSPLLGEWNGRNCHCGQSAARLAAKVHLDFSTFGLGSTSGSKTITRRSHVDSLVQSSVARHEPNTLEHLHHNHLHAHLSALTANESISGGHLLQYNSNGLLDLCSSTHSRIGQSVDDICTYMPTSAHLPINLPPQSSTDHIAADSVDSVTSIGPPPLPPSNRPLLGGIHNQLGQNVAADIRRRLEQIKANALRPTSALSSSTAVRPTSSDHGPFAGDRLIVDHEQDRSGGSSSPQDVVLPSGTMHSLNMLTSPNLTNLNELSVDDEVSRYSTTSAIDPSQPNERPSFNAFTFKV